MAFLKRLSDSLWDIVSPRKNHPALLPSPQSGTAGPRKASLEDITNKAMSMSPSERVQGWRVQTPVSVAGKRKRQSTPGSFGAGRQRKQSKLTEWDMQDLEDYNMGDEQPSYLRTPPSRLSRARTKSPSLVDDDDNMSDATGIRVDDGSFPSPPRRKVVNFPAELNMRHLSDDVLREEGWDDDYITLIQKIAMRGYEPLLPAYMKFEYNFLPDALFEKTDDAFVSSVRRHHFRASKALEKLLELGGKVRDRRLLEGGKEPEEEVQRELGRFIKWAEDDAGLDRRTTIPILAHVYEPAGTPGAALMALAEEKCRRLAQRWRRALKAQPSVEFSPGTNNTQLHYELPTFYAIIASHTLVGLVAYKIDEDKCTPMAQVDYNDKDYDVWNSLALAIVACHVRNVQLRIAEDIGIGARPSGSDESEESLDDDA